MCQKNNKDDVFHFCNCFDKAGNPLTGTDVENTAYYACCNCPGERREAIKDMNILQTSLVSTWQYILISKAMLIVGQNFDFD